jgi:hypothetical protein
MFVGRQEIRRKVWRVLLRRHRSAKVGDRMLHRPFALSRCARAPRAAWCVQPVCKSICVYGLYVAEGVQPPYAPQPASASTGTPAPRAALFATRVLLSSSAKFMRGDWTCAACEAHNFRSRQACFKCAAPRPQQASGDSQSQSPSSGRPAGTRGTHPRPSQTFGTISEERVRAYRAGQPLNWLCEKCLEVNFARRASCFFCTHPRPASLAPDALPNATRTAGAEHAGSLDKPADDAPAAAKAPETEQWHCQACGVPNAAARTWCFVCSADRPAPRAPSTTANGAQAGETLAWICPTCNEANPRSTEECGCGELRPSDAELDELERALGIKPLRPYEWACMRCTMLNFRTRPKCVRCGLPKEGVSHDTTRQLARGGAGAPS